MKKKTVRTLLISLAVAVVIAQLVPLPPAENPPVGQEVPAPPEVRTILKASCYDCHSNETVWPWYSRVIPTKWLVRGNVVEGRGHMNFSTWGEYPPDRAARRLENVVEVVEDGKMPPSSYLWLHGDAALSEEAAARIIEWARDLRGGSPSTETGPVGEGAGIP